MFSNQVRQNSSGMARNLYFKLRIKCGLTLDLLMTCVLHPKVNEKLEGVNPSLLIIYEEALIPM